MIVLRTPKGWTGPKIVDGKPTEGTWRSHQVPLADVRDDPTTSPCSRRGSARTGPTSCSTADGRPRDEILDLAPRGGPTDERQPARQRRAAPPRPAPARLPRLRRRRRGAGDDRPARRPGSSGRGCATSSATTRRHSACSVRTRPSSNRLDSLFEVTDRVWMGEIRPTDEHLAPSGRVLEVLSEHLCQGWLEGYLLTGRHGLFNCYEAFIHVIDSMFNQHAKWLKMTREIPLAPAHRLAQLPPDQPRLAPGPQRLQPPGPGLHRPRRQQEGRGDPGLPPARRELPAVRRRPLPPQPELRQRHRRRQAAGARLTCRWTTRSSIARAASASGSGPATTTAIAGRRDGLLR